MLFFSSRSFPFRRFSVASRDALCTTLTTSPLLSASNIFLGKLALNGHKQKKIILPGDVQIDLFIVTPPAQWGVIFLLRTGSDKFSHRFVTHKSFGGCMPAAYRMQDGAIWCGNRMIETPDERDLFKLFNMRYIPPVERVA